MKKIESQRWRHMDTNEPITVREATACIQWLLNRGWVSADSQVWDSDSAVNGTFRKRTRTVKEVLEELKVLDQNEDLVLVSSDGWHDPVMEIVIAPKRTAQKYLDGDSHVYLAAKPQNNILVLVVDEMLGHQE